MRSLIHTLLADISGMTRKEHLLYWIIPILVLAICMLFYFSEIPELVSIICPPGNWEWGIVENLQLVIILGIFILAIRGFSRKTDRLLKWGFGLTAIFAIFILLEEMDYGEHFAQYIMGVEEVFSEKFIPIDNLHNRGNNAKIFKRSIYLVMLLIFIIAPFTKPIIKNRYLRFLIPRPSIILVAVLTVIADLVPRLVVLFQWRKDGGFGVNIGEFSEIMVYHIFFIYMLQLVYFNVLETNTKDPEHSTPQK